MSHHIPGTNFHFGGHPLSTETCKLACEAIKCGRCGHNRRRSTPIVPIGALIAKFPQNWSSCGRRRPASAAFGPVSAQLVLGSTKIWEISAGLGVGESSRLHSVKLPGPRKRYHKRPADDGSEYSQLYAAHRPPEYQHLECPAIPLVYRLWSNFPTCAPSRLRALEGQIVGGGRPGAARRLERRSLGRHRTQIGRIFATRTWPTPGHVCPRRGQRAEFLPRWPCLSQVRPALVASEPKLANIGPKLVDTGPNLPRLGPQSGDAAHSRHQHAEPPPMTSSNGVRHSP